MFGRKVWFVAAFFWAAVTFAEDSVPAPEKLKLDRATYHKITISWEYPAVDGIAVKVIYDPKKGRIVSGYPTNTPRNPK